MSTTRRKTALMGQLLDQVRHQFKRAKDVNGAGANAYPAVDCLMSGLALFVLKFPSLLKFDNRRDEPVLRGNLKRLFGIKRAPSDTTLRRRLDAVDAKVVQRAFRVLIGWLLRHRHLEAFRTADGALPLMVDATGYFTSTKVSCERCLRHRTRGGETRFRHAMLGAVVAHPDVAQVIPVAAEPIINGDGNKKQDCEQNAFKRLLPQLLKARQRTRFIVIADALYANAPVVRQLREAQQDFILTLKDDGHAHALAALADEGYRELADEPRVLYRWRHAVQLNERHGDDCLVTVIEQTAWDRRGHGTRWTWATNRPIASAADAHAVARLGRARWRIENNVFKTLKDEDGYHFAHNYGHGKSHLCTIMMLLMFLAFTLDQVNTMACARFQAARRYEGTWYAVWEAQRVLVRRFIWPSWDHFYDQVAGIPPDT